MANHSRAVANILLKKAPKKSLNKEETKRELSKPDNNKNK